MSGRVLLIDDDPSMVELLQARLTQRGFTLTTRTDPQAALPLVMEQPFDVVLTDLNMQGLSGTELCERVVVVASGDPSELTTLKEVERRDILRVMEEVKGNKSLAAQILGRDRKTLYRKLDRIKGSGE